MKRFPLIFALARGWLVLPAAIALIVFLAAVGVDVHVLLPEYFAREGYRAPLVQLLALPVAVTAVLMLEEPVERLWRTSVRPVRMIAAVRVVVPLFIAVAAAFALGVDRGLTAGVTLLSLAAQALAARRFVGPILAWMLPSMHIIAASFFGVAEDAVRVWAWPIAVELSFEQAAAVLGVTMICLVVAATGRLSRRDFTGRGRRRVGHPTV